MDRSEAEALGRAAVEEGMPCLEGLMALDEGGPWRLGEDYPEWVQCIPDFNDPLTALAVIPWVESVAREVYGGSLQEYRFGFEPGGRAWVEIESSTSAAKCLDVEGSTLPHAAIAAVRAMKGGER